MSDNGGQASCEYCNNLVYDEEMEEYVCDVDMDEDDYARLLSSSYRNCPYYQSNDEYKVVTSDVAGIRRNIWIKNLY